MHSLHLGGEGKLRANYEKKWGKKLLKRGWNLDWSRIIYKGPAISRQIKPPPIPSHELGLQKVSIRQNWQFSSSALLWMQLHNPLLLIQIRQSRKLWVNQHVPGEKKKQRLQTAEKARKGGSRNLNRKKTNSRCMIKHGRVVALGHWESYGKCPLYCTEKHLKCWHTHTKAAIKFD